MLLSGFSLASVAAPLQIVPAVTIEEVLRFPP